MRRAVVITGITAVGAAWILSYKVAPQTSGLAVGSLPSQGSAHSSPEATPPGSPSPATSPSGTFTGRDFPNRFGDVQVQVIISHGRITEVKALQLPYDRARSAYISQVAGPMLRTEALQAQSARIDIISGATYTSDSYAQSLETALQQAQMG
ncbi:MAG TPA: FMN-binding protein [Candidatus Dormibacteraeota bacterium]|jgi:uncharacterized protein with FMN-binding domain